MSSGRQTVRDLVEEAKKRIVLLFVCVIGLSYLMSLTSSSVWVNLPAAASLVLLLRYISYDLDMRRRSAACNRAPSANNISPKVPFEATKVLNEKSNWRRKVNSPAVEAAIDHFTRHLVSEWVTNLWYSRVTPDTDGPEELVQIMNGVLGEFSFRMRDINLIDLLTRDVINLICNNLELHCTCQAKIAKCESGKLTIEQRDVQLKHVLASENKLHPALISATAEHKVLQHLMDGLIGFTFRPEDLQCSYFRYTARELLACAVMRPVLNLVNPSFINERIENLVLSMTNKANKGDTPAAQDASQIRATVPSKNASDHFFGSQDRSNKGLELVQVKHNRAEVASGKLKTTANGQIGEPQSSGSPLLPDYHNGNCKGVQANTSSGEWGQMLDIMSSRKTQALAPEHFDNMWTKGRNYKKKDVVHRSAKQVTQNSLTGVTSKHNTVDHTINFDSSGISDDYTRAQIGCVGEDLSTQIDGNNLSQPYVVSHQEKNKQDLMHIDETGVESGSSYPSEDDENSSVTGLDSPGTKVWDSKNNRTAMGGSYIRHPLENSEGNMGRKSRKGHIQFQRMSKTHSGRKRSRVSSQKMPVWQEVERTSFSLGDGLDILNASKHDLKTKESSDDSELENWGRVHSGEDASSSAPSISTPEAYNASAKSSQYSLLANSFLKLRCEVLGANIVRSGSSTFAVYSISVTDADNNNWSIKRRFRHFEELHRRLKEFPEYDLGLPPKHFLSSGLDVSVVQERCKLLDTYLKKLLQLPTVSESIEVWDFLSVDSQTYMFSNSLSIVETLSVDLDDKAHEKNVKVPKSVEAQDINVCLSGAHVLAKSKESSLHMKGNDVTDGLKLKTINAEDILRRSGKECETQFEDNSGSDSDGVLHKNISSFPIHKSPVGPDGQQDTSGSFHEAASDPTLPTEWVPPNLSVPLLNLVDVLFQLKDGGWIRRQVFWVAKQVLQLGMGDAFDDWLIDKIQLLRKGSVIASIISRIEQILWPDGIFITKHPKRQRPPVAVSHSPNSSSGSYDTLTSPRKEGLTLDNNGKENDTTYVDEQALEAARRAKLVYEIMIDNAPAALVSLVGRKEYQRCAHDAYFFLQSPVCLKQLAFELLELLILSTFPELKDVVKQCHEEKERFGQLA